MKNTKRDYTQLRRLREFIDNRENLETLKYFFCQIKCQSTGKNKPAEISAKVSNNTDSEKIIHFMFPNS